MSPIEGPNREHVLHGPCFSAYQHGATQHGTLPLVPQMSLPRFLYISFFEQPALLLPDVGPVTIGGLRTLFTSLLSFVTQALRLDNLPGVSRYGSEPARGSWQMWRSGTHFSNLSMIFVSEGLFGPKKARGRITEPILSMIAPATSCTYARGCIFWTWSPAIYYTIRVAQTLAYAMRLPTERYSPLSGETTLDVIPG